MCSLRSIDTTFVFIHHSLITPAAHPGHLITLVQFLVVVLAVWPFQLDVTQPFGLKKTAAPIQRWVASALMFMLVNVLNNWAFAFDISVPVHIILRSFGSVTAMAVGWLNGKKYSLLQVVSVCLLTTGVLISAWADLSSKSEAKMAEEKSGSSLSAGLFVLLAAQIIGAFMGLYVENTYRLYGKDWQDAIFYNHLFSLPFFGLLYQPLIDRYRLLSLLPPLRLSSPLIPAPLGAVIQSIPSPMVFLFLNAFTQLACISGVNILGANSSALTVSIVLNIRKLISFLISIFAFGNPMSPLMSLGATLVFGSGILYGWETSPGMPARASAALSASAKSADRSGPRRSPCQKDLGTEPKETSECERTGETKMDRKSI